MKNINYAKYKLSIMEYAWFGCIFAAVLFLISYLFYDTLILGLFMFPLIIFYYKFVSRYLCEKRKKLLLLQFRDMINAMSVSLNSGYSIENAMRECKKEMQLLYGEKSYIYKEIAQMLNKLAVNISIEEVFREFALRSECADILIFSQIINIAKRTGGDLISIIKSSSETISEKIDVQRDIETCLSAKRFEQNIMSVMPLAIMIYIHLTSQDFFNGVYHNPTGIFIMTFSLILYLAAVFLGLKLSAVKVI